MTVKIIQGDARSTGLDAGSVHCIATSPPYWGLRFYDADPRQIGNEPRPEAYVESMREVGHECFRVLRDDGVMFINLGDTYATGPCSWSNNGLGASSLASTNGPRDAAKASEARPIQRSNGGLAQGNIIGIPWRVAFALQADGWILRAAIPWIKANGMPESVKNRPTVAHEYVFLFAKRAGYFYDADAVRVVSARPDLQGQERLAGVVGLEESRNDCGTYHDYCNPAGRNLRTSDFMSAALDEYEAHVRRVRADGGLLLSPDGEPLTFLVNPVGSNLGHFAMWPPKLVAPMILAGTSERGCCPACGAQWRRRVEKTRTKPAAPSGNSEIGRGGAAMDGRESHLGDRMTSRDLGFFPSCSCPAHEPIPSTVLDVFGGTATTAQVAEALGRDSVIVELNEDYHPLIRQRLAERLNPADWKAVPKAPVEQGSLF